MIFELLKSVIRSGKSAKEDIKDKMDVFLLNDRITKRQYEELLKLLQTSLL